MDGFDDIILQELPDESVKLSRRHRIRAIFIIALPVMIQNLVHHLQMIIDRAFLGNIDSRFLSVIGNVMVPYSALGLFLVSVSTGLTILVAQNIGAKRFEKARDYAESSFVFATLMSTMIFAIWIFFASGIFSLLGVESSIRADAVLYVSIISVSMILMGVDITSAAILSGAGYTSPIMITGIIKNVMNIFLDYVLIFGKFGFDEMGLKGAAIATVIANGIGAVCLLSIALSTKKLPFVYSLRALLRPKWNFFWETMRLGLPSGFESLLWFTGQLVLVRMINEINPLSIGILSLVQSLNHLALFIYLGFARSAISLVGQYWGASNFDDAKRVGLECQFFAFVVSFTWSMVLLVFPRELAGMFTNDAGIIESSAFILRLSSLFINFQVVNVIMGHAIRGTGDTKWMLYSQIFGTFFVVGVSFFMIFHFSWGLVGVVIAMTMDEGLRGGVNFMRFLKSVNAVN